MVIENDHESALSKLLFVFLRGTNINENRSASILGDLISIALSMGSRNEFETVRLKVLVDALPNNFRRKAAIWTPTVIEQIHRLRIEMSFELGK